MDERPHSSVPLEPGGADQQRIAALTVELGQAGPVPLSVSISCAPGELLALVGPSGAGKTTLLRMIAGLGKPRQGRIAIGDDVWFDSARGVFRRPQERRVGFVFQDYALFPHLSAEANVALALGHISRRHRPARARALLDQVNLQGLEARRPFELSGGQRQRVAVARALAREPRVLLLDEPFAAVDQVTRRKLQDELLRLRTDLNLPIVLVTHDLGEARQLANRMCVIHRGRTLQAGPPEDLLTQPRSPLVARLVDLANVYDATVAGHDRAAGHTLLDWHGYRLETPCRPDVAPGEAVTWVVPPAFIVLHRRERPSQGERENAVAGRIRSIVYAGDQAKVQLEVTSGGGQPPSLGGAAPVIGFSVSAHVARRNGLAPNAAAKVSLLGEGIHIMTEDDADGSSG